MSPVLALIIPIPSLTNVLAFLGSVALCATLTSGVLRYQRGVGFDTPDDHRKKHDRTISRLGGLPIFVTLMLGIVITLWIVPSQHVSQEWWPVIFANTLVFLIGFLDDLRPLGARLKLVGQIGAACLLYSLGHSIDFVTNPVSHAHIALGWWSPVVTVLWLIAIPNIINLIDGMDGLASGFGLFLCLTLAFVGHFSGMPDVVMMCTMMAGALAGFLMFNFPPAKIFLGDGGAYLIGFFIASVSLSTSRKGYILGALLVMVIALGVPILDTLFAIIRRGIRGVPLFRADAEHLHHRLIALGFSKGQALGIMYAVCAVLSLIGILVLTKRGLGTVIATAALALLALTAARGLGYVKSFRGLRRQFSGALARRRDLAFARAHGRVLELEVDRLASAPEFSELLARSLGRIQFALKPEHGRVVCSMKLKDGSLWKVGRLDTDRSDDQWRSQLESMLAGVEAAMTRWQDLPGVVREHPGAEFSQPAHTVPSNPTPTPP
jgi:UDP-GlcNAc:undecaprenyl-phosphate GlcNAc-1-phosphate transferase